MKQRQEGYPEHRSGPYTHCRLCENYFTDAGINRFVSGQRVFSRFDIEVNMMVKKGLSVESEETLAKMRFEPTDTVFDVYRTMNSAVDEILSSPADTGTERVAKSLLKLPRPILRFAIWAIRKGDYYGLLGKDLLDISPFHGSVIFTDLSSLGIPPFITTSITSAISPSSYPSAPSATPMRLTGKQSRPQALCGRTIRW